MGTKMIGLLLIIIIIIIGFNPIAFSCWGWSLQNDWSFSQWIQYVHCILLKQYTLFLLFSPTLLVSDAPINVRDHCGLRPIDVVHEWAPNSIKSNNTIRWGNSNIYCLFILMDKHVCVHSKCHSYVAVIG